MSIQRYINNITNKHQTYKVNYCVHPLDHMLNNITLELLVLHPQQVKKVTSPYDITFPEMLLNLQSCYFLQFILKQICLSTF